MSSPIIPLLVCFVLVHIHVLQGYIQIAKCSVALGDLSAVDSAISVVKELSPNNAAIYQRFRNWRLLGGLMRRQTKLTRNKTTER